MKRILALALAVALTGCAAVQDLAPVGQTPAQRFYEMAGYYLILESVAAEFVRTDLATPEVKKQIATLAIEATTAIEEGSLALSTCNARKRDLGPESACSDEEELLLLSSAALSQVQGHLTEVLKNEGAIQ